MAKIEAVAAMLIIGTLAGTARAQAPTTLVPSSALPTVAPAPVAAPSPVTRPQPIVQSKQNAEADPVRRSVDERLRRRDAAARRAMQGICKGC